MSSPDVAWSRRSGARRVLKRGEQLTVQVGVGVQATALIARMSSGSIGETAARFLDEKNPWRVIPDRGDGGDRGLIRPRALGNALGGHGS